MQVQKAANIRWKESAVAANTARQVLVQPDPQPLQHYTYARPVQLRVSSHFRAWQLWSPQLYHKNMAAFQAAQLTLKTTNAAREV
jgi:hypothetical protein